MPLFKFSNTEQSERFQFTQTAFFGILDAQFERTGLLFDTAFEIPMPELYCDFGFSVDLVAPVPQLFFKTQEGFSFNLPAYMAILDAELFTINEFDVDLVAPFPKLSTDPSFDLDISAFIGKLFAQLSVQNYFSFIKNAPLPIFYASFSEPESIEFKLGSIFPILTNYFLQAEGTFDFNVPSFFPKITVQFSSQQGHDYGDEIDQVLRHSSSRRYI